MSGNPGDNSEEQKQQQSVQHNDASTWKQIELDALYALMLQNIEDLRGAMRLQVEQKEREEKMEDEKKEGE